MTEAGRKILEKLARILAGLPPDRKERLLRRGEELAGRGGKAKAAGPGPPGGPGEGRPGTRPESRKQARGPGWAGKKGGGRMTLYIHREKRLILYGEEEAVGFMLEEMDLAPGYGMSLSTWMHQEGEPARFMRTEVRDSFYSVRDWDVVRNAGREEIDRAEIALFGQVTTA